MFLFHSMRSCSTIWLTAAVEIEDPLPLSDCISTGKCCLILFFFIGTCKVLSIDCTIKFRFFVHKLQSTFEKPSQMPETGHNSDGSNFRIFAHYVSTKSNDFAESLSRLQFNQFHNLSKGKMCKYPELLPSISWPSKPRVLSGAYTF